MRMRLESYLFAAPSTGEHLQILMEIADTCAYAHMSFWLFVISTCVRGQRSL